MLLIPSVSLLLSILAAGSPPTVEASFDEFMSATGLSDGMWAMQGATAKAEEYFQLYPEAVKRLRVDAELDADPARAKKLRALAKRMEQVAATMLLTRDVTRPELVRECDDTFVKLRRAYEKGPSNVPRFGRIHDQASQCARRFVALFNKIMKQVDEAKSLMREFGDLEG